MFDFSCDCWRVELWNARAYQKVESKSDLNVFIKCQWNFYKDDPHWVPPLIMERKTVVKFGGSNLQKPEDFQKLVKVVRNYNKPIVIVVSAFCGVTDKLTKTMTDDVNSTQNIKLICNDLANIHKQIIFHNILKWKVLLKTKIFKNKKKLSNFR